MTQGRFVGLRIAVLAVVIGILLFLEVRYHILAWFERERIASLLRRAGPLAPFLYMVAMALAVIISPIPSLPLDVAAGVFFGPWLGTLYSLVGALTGAVASFSIARRMGRDVVEKITQSHVGLCTRCSDRLLTKVVLVSRLIPVVSFDVISYGAGLTAMRLSRFTIATAIGMLPLTFVYNTFGAIVVVKSWISLSVAAVFLVLFFLLPRLIERHNLFGMKRYLDHT